MEATNDRVHKAYRKWGTKNGFQPKRKRGSGAKTAAEKKKKKKTFVECSSSDQEDYDDEESECETQLCETQLCEQVSQEY